MPEYEILSRPAPATGQYEIISKPKPTELDADGNPRVPVEGDVPAPQAERRMPGTQYGQLVDEAMGNMREGAGRVIAPNVSAWERTKGAGQAALGAAGYVGAPAEYAARKVVGDPVEAVVRLIAGDTAGKMAGDTASGVAGLVGGAAAPKLVREVPGMIREGGKLIGQAADLAGPVARSAVDTVEDLVKQRMKNYARSKADKLANAAPTKDDWYDTAATGFAKVKATGGAIDPEEFKQVISGTLDPATGQALGGAKAALKANDVDIIGHPENFPETAKMLKALDRKAAGVSEDGAAHPDQTMASFNDLVTLQRSLRPYIRRARAAGEAVNDSSDYRAASILKKQVDDFMLSQGDATNAELSSAKDAYKRAAKMEDIEDILGKSARLNDPEFLQQKFRKIALDDYVYNNFTPAEQKLVDQIAGTGKWEKAGEFAAPGSHGMGLAKATGYAVMGAAHPSTLVVPAAAMALKAATTPNRVKLAKQLMDMISRGGEAQKAAAAEKAAQPSFMDRFNDTMRPRSPYSNNPTTPRPPPRRPVEIIDVPGLRKP